MPRRPAAAAALSSLTCSLVVAATTWRRTARPTPVCWHPRPSPPLPTPGLTRRKCTVLPLPPAPAPLFEALTSKLLTLGVLVRFSMSRPPPGGTVPPPSRHRDSVPPPEGLTSFCPPVAPLPPSHCFPSLSCSLQLFYLPLQILLLLTPHLQPFLSPSSPTCINPPLHSHPSIPSPPSLLPFLTAPSPS